MRVLVWSGGLLFVFVLFIRCSLLGLIDFRALFFWASKEERLVRRDEVSVIRMRIVRGVYIVYREKIFENLE